MIQIESISINAFRGIKNLTLDLRKNNFAVYGPNGTGKSGIIDAIEFALTGSISRLSGEGMGNVSVKEHAPHVDHRDNPAKSSVVISVFIPSLNKSATVTRTVKDLSKPLIVPADDDICNVLNNISEHPEFTLTRRELMKYVLSTPGKRSDEVQSLLRLDKIESLRTVLNKISNSAEKQAGQQEKTRNIACKELIDALNISTFSAANILQVVNERRVILGLPKIESLEAETSLKDGIGSIALKNSTAKIAKNQAILDVNDVKNCIMAIREDKYKESSQKIIKAIHKLKKNISGLRDISKENLFNTALAEFDNEQCPVCDTKWDPKEFKLLLAQKTEKLKEAKQKRNELSSALNLIIEPLELLKRSIEQTAKYGMLFTPAIQPVAFSDYFQQISQHIIKLKDVTNLDVLISTLDAVIVCPQSVLDLISEFEKAIQALPDPSKQDSARDFLVLGQERLEKYRQASRNLARAKHQAEISKHIYELYASVVTEELGAIYKQVESSFAELYREIHHEDESAFLAKLEPSIGKLGFDVDFYGRGYFPPGAYHSEGHQDGMGLCLYLALMRYTQGDNFRFAVLDDVLMSVDAGHRRDVSRLFKKHFPDVQFIMTTHDEVWLRSMQTEGLIDRKDGFIFFKSWDVDCGPTRWSDRDAWTEIADELQNNNVRASAALLRNYLEYTAKEMCNRLRASVEFRGDGQYALGDLLPNATSRMVKLLSEGRNVAESWSDSTATQALEKKKTELTAARDKSNIENWQTNSAVHYNEWANLQKGDFEPVVAAYKNLVDQFKCPQCNGLIYLVFDRNSKQALRCNCAHINFNLAKKQG
ncbi:AAA family ATPase [Desulfovibrio sp. OttesenSCG-928-G11]|nr:AAA family ATPase [Desulfovibrio sp. OttesenSCG-928-G11]